MCESGETYTLGFLLPRRLVSSKRLLGCGAMALYGWESCA